MEALKIKKVVLVSFFNSSNLGDILISDSLYDLISKKFIVEKISYSGDLKVNKSTNTEIDNNHMKVKIIKSLKSFELVKKIHFYYKKFQKINLSYYETKISTADVLVIGGGNMIFDLDKYSLSSKRFSRFVDIAKKNKKKVFAISLGIGPFQTTSQSVAAVRALEKCDYITFRDLSSYEIFRKHNQSHNNVYVTIDPVFMLEKKIKNTNEEKVIALNVINNKLINENEKSYQNTIHQYSELADTLVDLLKFKVTLFSTEVTDYEAVNDVYSRVNNKDMINVCIVTNEESLMDLYEKTLILIGTRMHSMIIAHSQHIPVIGLSWQKKVDSMFEIINSKDSLFKYNEISINLAEIINCAKYKTENIEREKMEIEENLTLLNTKVEINNNILEQLNILS